MKVKRVEWIDPDNRAQNINIDTLSRVCVLICSDFFLKQGRIAFSIVSDEELLQLNIRHLQHYTLTDVITFPYNNSDIVNGEIFISADRALDNAILNKTNATEEILRYAIHGLLHLCGLEDDTEKKKLEIHHFEDMYLCKYKEFHVKP